MAPSPDPLARARLQGKRVALGLVFGATAWIIGTSALQIVPAVFGAGVTPLPSSPPGSPARTCAEGVQRMARALERASASAGSAAFGEQLSPEWDTEAAVQAACAATPEGQDAWASLARMRSAEEQLGPRASGVADLHRDVIAHLPADLR